MRRRHRRLQSVHAVRPAVYSRRSDPRQRRPVLRQYRGTIFCAITIDQKADVKKFDNSLFRCVTVTVEKNTSTRPRITLTSVMPPRHDFLCVSRDQQASNIDDRITQSVFHYGVPLLAGAGTKDVACVRQKSCICINYGRGLLSFICTENSRVWLSCLVTVARQHCRVAYINLRRQQQYTTHVESCHTKTTDCQQFTGRDLWRSHKFVPARLFATLSNASLMTQFQGVN